MQGDARDDLLELKDLLMRRGRMDVRSESSSESFGDAIVELCGHGVVVRIIRDRGSILLDVSPGGGSRWHRLSDVLSFLQLQPSSQDARALVDSFVNSAERVAHLIARDPIESGLAHFEREAEAATRTRIFS